jgi:hypothetical protein
MQAEEVIREERAARRGGWYDPGPIPDAGTTQENSMRRRLTSILLAIALLSLATRPSLLAQEGPSGTPVLRLYEGVGSANYGYVRLPSDPALPITMRVVRVTIEPGAAVPTFATTG